MSGSSDLADSVVLITGAAGNLGAAAARGFFGRGARPVLLDRGSGRLAQQFPELALSPRALLVDGVDLTRFADVERAAGQAVGRFGRIDVLVNAAGGYRGGVPLHEAPLDDWDFLMDLNARSVLHACRAVVPVMLRAGSGRIVSVAARAALAGFAGHAAYSSSKSAVLRITESLAAELGGKGINVNCVLPALIDTPQNRAAMPKADPRAWVTPEAIVEVILFLASPGAGAVHGAALPVYGRG